MRLSDFDYDLPEQLIAQVPLEDRASSRMLVIDKATGAIEHSVFLDLASRLERDDLLVLNDTRVSAVRLFGRRKSGGSVEALLMREANPGTFVALVRPAKKLKVGEVVEFEEELAATVESDLGEGKKEIRFVQSDFRERLAKAGSVPLPPYVHTALSDPERYQTVYSRCAGSSAAPTAGLHFTNDLFELLDKKGVRTATVTLDVSVDTFRPMACEDVGDHVMHGEVCRIPEETVQAVQQCTGRVVAIGTTTVRTLESFATGRKRLGSGEMVSKLFVTPGYEFKIVDALLTNFHMPRTTMMLMVSALAGTDVLLEAYRQAVEHQYRFLSFGDSMLIL